MKFGGVMHPISTVCVLVSLIAKSLPRNATCVILLALHLMYILAALYVHCTATVSTLLQT